MIDPIRMIIVNIALSLIIFLILLIYKLCNPKKSINIWVILLIISILPIVSIFREGTYESGDLTLHSVFLESFYMNLSQGIPIPHWAGDLCAGFGCPAHLFEYPLPFYIGSFFHALGFSFVNSIKGLLILSFVGSGIGMYLWLKEEFPKHYALFGTIFYLFAPYHLADLHFRISVGEVLSFLVIPFIFLFLKKLIETKKGYFILLEAVAISLLVLAHGNTILSILPVLFIYLYFLIMRDKKRKEALLYASLSFLLAIALSAFYLVPVLFEIKYTWYVKGLITTDFKPFWEYIFSPTRFGFLFQGNQGELRLIIGYFHLLIVIIATALIFMKKISPKFKVITILLLINFFIYFLMLQQFSKPLWDVLPLFHTFILPWRLLVPISFITAILATIVAMSIKNKKILVVIGFLTIFSTMLNWGNRKMVPQPPNAFQTHWSMYTEYFEPGNEVYEKRYTQRVAKIPELILYPPLSHLEILSGQGEIKELKRSQIHHEYLVYAKTDMKLAENTFYFPGWELYVDGEKTLINNEEKNKFGLITFSVEEGLHHITVQFKDTSIRKIGMIISGISLILIMFFFSFYIVKSFNKNK